MITSPHAGDVLRGMRLELQPLRVGRAHPVDPPPTSPEPPTQELDQLFRERVEAELLLLRGGAERQGYEAGLQEGREAGEREAEAARREAEAERQAALGEELRKLRALAASLAGTREEMLRDAEDDMVALCFDAMCRMVGELAPDPESVRARLRAAAARLPAADELVLRVHPADAELLASGTASEERHVRWVPDPDVALGGCIVEHGGGALDLRFETALAICKDALATERARRAHAGAQS